MGVFSKLNKEYIIIGILIVVIIMIVYCAWHKDAENEARVQQAMVMSQEDAKDKNILQNKLDISKQNAEMLSDFIAQEQMGTIKPLAHFTVKVPSAVEASKEVVKRINGRDLALPPTVLDKTDSTIVAVEKLNAQQQTAARQWNENNANGDKPKMNDEYGVAVYKNNNYRNWEWSLGYGWQNGEGYIPIGLQRNYSKDRAVVVEVHLDAGTVKNVNGWEVRQVWKVDKTFLIF